MIPKLWHGLWVAQQLLCAAVAVEGQTAPAASVNDNRAPGGVLRNGVLTIYLEARPAVWFPEKDGRPHLTVSAFAEEGHAPQIPGPLIRVPAETEVFATIRNRLDHTIYVHGFGPHTTAAPVPPPPPDPSADIDPNALEIGAGAVREVRFKAGAPPRETHLSTLCPASTANRGRTPSISISASVILCIGAGSIPATPTMQCTCTVFISRLMA